MEVLKVNPGWSKNGDPIAYAQGTVEIPQDSLRMNAKGTVYMYLVAPAVIVDSENKPILKTQISGTLILRAAPVLG